MITIISPAKNMKVDKMGTEPQTLPHFVDEAKEIWEELRKLSPLDLQILMKINENLAEDSFDRIQTVKWDMEGTSAVETYDGIQYKYMDPKTFSEKGKTFAKNHLRVLSGFYGVVRPYDSIYEYRLEMLTKMTVGDAKNLYGYWGSKLYDQLTRELEGEKIILNLASDEYGKTIKKYIKEPYKMVTCIFKTYSKGKHKVLATAAKMARGSMVRYICENQIDCIEDVKKFDWDGYRYEESLSGEGELVFLQG